MSPIRSVFIVGSLFAFSLLFSEACESQSTAPTTAAPAAPAPVTTAAPAASGPSGIKAVVKFSGPPPVMAKLKREADPFCAKTPMNNQEVVVNANGTLKNVVVRVVKGAAPAATPPAEPVLVDQNNCMYAPRIVAGVTGQKLLIKNSDPIMHNVHSYTGATTGFNQAQMKGSKDIEKTIAAGVMKFKCDVHPWMTGYIVGHDNPFVCVTGDTGDCTIANLPAGAYTLEAWHEKYGAKTVDLAAGAAAAEFTFGGQ